MDPEPPGLDDYELDDWTGDDGEVELDETTTGKEEEESADDRSRDLAQAERSRKPSFDTSGRDYR